MNRRQRRRLNRRIKADQELYALRWARRIALVVPVLLLGVLAMDAESSLTELSDIVRLLALLAAVLAFSLVAHGFRVRLAHRRGEWASGDPTIVIEDIADIYDVDEDAVAAPAVTATERENRFRQQVIEPLTDGMADRITAALHREGTLPANMRFVVADAPDDQS